MPHVAFPPDPRDRGRRTSAGSCTPCAGVSVARGGIGVPRFLLRYVDAGVELARGGAWRDAECGHAAARAVRARLGERCGGGDARLAADPLSGMVACWDP